MKFDNFSSIFYGGLKTKIIQDMADYQEVIAKIGYVTKYPEEDIFRMINNLNKGEPNIETAKSILNLFLQSNNFDELKNTILTTL